MLLEIIFATLLFAVSTMLLVKSMRLNKDEFLIEQAERAMHRFEVNDIDNLHMFGRDYAIGAALLRNKKTGEYRWINQVKPFETGLLGQ